MMAVMILVSLALNAVVESLPGVEGSVLSAMVVRLGLLVLLVYRMR